MFVSGVVPAHGRVGRIARANAFEVSHVSGDVDVDIDVDVNIDLSSC